jgi:hypothetical protein
MCEIQQDSRARRTLLNNHQVGRTTSSKLLLVAMMLMLFSATPATMTMARPFGSCGSTVLFGKRAFLAQRQTISSDSADRKHPNLVSTTASAAAAATQEEEDEEANMIVAKYAFVRAASPEDLAQLHQVGFSYSIKHSKRQEQQQQQQQQQHESMFASELEILESDVVSVSGRIDCSHPPELQLL